LLGQTVGVALVALIFGFPGSSGDSRPIFAILLAAGFAALAAVLSVLRLLNIIRPDPSIAPLQQPAMSGKPNRSADEQPAVGFLNSSFSHTAQIPLFFN
jgi:hypothetical protein